MLSIGGDAMAKLRHRTVRPRRPWTLCNKMFQHLLAMSSFFYSSALILVFSASTLLVWDRQKHIVKKCSSSAKSFVGRYGGDSPTQEE